MNTCRINNDIDVSRIVLGTDYYGKTIPEMLLFLFLIVIYHMAVMRLTPLMYIRIIFRENAI